MRFLGSALRLTAATVLVAAVGLVLPAAPASAAACSSADGVSVVVDFHQLGGGVQTVCVPDGGGRTAAALFPAAGFALSYVQRQPGFVCQVDAKPASPCQTTPPADAYWGLWWSDGESGGWTYATRGVGSQTVPDGGYVALSWNGSSARSAPGVSPTAHPAVPTPTTKPTGKASTKPSSKPSTKPTKSQSTKPVNGASSTPSSSEPSTASSTPGESPSKQPSGKAGQPTKPPGGVDGEMLPESAPASTESTDNTDAAPASSDPADPADDGLPTWVGPVVVGVLFAAGGAVAVVRRRRTPTP